MRAGIIGATGYGGLELFRLLTSHPDISQLFLYTSTKAGSSISNQAPHLFNLYAEQLKPITKLEEDAVDVVFCSAPSGVSTRLLPPLIEKGIKVIDLAGDYRLQDPLMYERWYKKESPLPSYLNKAVYGLPEWNKSSIHKATLLSNPGCYPTAVLLGLLPLVKEGYIDSGSLIIDAKSGLSGAGTALHQSSHYAMANESMSIYKINEHQHIPEIEQGLWMFGNHETKITFSTHLAPMTRGIMATMYGNLKLSLNHKEVASLYERYYGEHPFIRVFKEKAPLSTKEVYGSNFCDLTFSIDERTNRITIVSVIDNLVKGAAGQAVQNMNIMFGLEEIKGINHVPVFP